MDGRDLSKEIIQDYKPELSLYDIANEIPKFIQKVINATSYNFYGEYQIGAIYDIRNFNNMLVSSFICQLDLTNEMNKFINLDKDFLLVLTDDCLLFFEIYEKNPNLAKLIFWSTLFGMTDIQINNEKKKAKINFYSEENKVSKELRIFLNNILSFKEEILNRMNNLHVIVEKNTESEMNEQKKILLKDIEKMNIDSIEYYIDIFRKKIEKEVNYYNVNTFTVLIGKAIEFYSANDNNTKNDAYLKEMKYLLMRKDVQKVMNESK